MRESELKEEERRRGEAPEERETERELRVFCPHICSGSLYH